MVEQKRSFVHLTTQTGFTPGALGTPESYASAAKRNNISIGIADTAPDAWIPFETACRQAQVTPLFGGVVYPLIDSVNRSRVSLHALDARGLTNIIRILDSQDTRKNTFDIADIAENSDGLIAIAAQPGYLAMRMTFDPQRLFYELTHVGDFESDLQIRQDALEVDDLNAQTVVTNRPWRAHPNPFDQFHSLTRIAQKAGQRLHQEEFSLTDISDNIVVHEWIRDRARPGNVFEAAASYHPEQYLKSPDQMRGLVPVSAAEHVIWQRGCDETGNIASNLMQALPRPSVPRYPVPEGRTAYSVLQERVQKAIPNRYPDWNSMGDRARQEIMERTIYELEAIGNRGLEDLFLIASDTVLFAKNQNPPIRMHGAGSDAGSQVCYLLEITNVPPIPNNLLFERFLDPEGVKKPDIDFHADAEHRDEIFDYLFSHYPHYGIYPARIATFPTWGIQGAVSDVLKVFGFSNTEIKTVKQILFPSRYSNDFDGEIRQNAKNQQIQTGVQPQLIEAAIDLKKRGIFKAHLSTHFSKVVFHGSSPPFVTLVDGKPRVSEDKDDVEDRSELNIDLVSSNVLTLLEHVLQATGFDEKDIPPDDEETIREVFLSHTTGVPGIETSYMKGVLWPYGKSTNWRTLLKKDLLLAILASRPGVTPEHREWLMDQRGKNQPFKYDYPVIDEILEESYGIVVSQEQIIRLVSQAGGFSSAESEQVRKHISKQREPEKLMEYAQQFFHRAVEKGIPQNQAQLLAEQIVHFSRYGFLKGHVMESILDDAYKLMFLKLRFPEAYVREVQKLGKGHFFKTGHPEAYEEELRRLLR